MSDVYPPKCVVPWCELDLNHDGDHDNPCGGRPGKPCGSCDCFMDIYPDDPFGLHPEAFRIGGPP